MDRIVVVGVGEVLWDLLPAGRKLGGAPCNFAYHCLALGAEAYVLSRVGNDEDGEDLLRELSEAGLDVSCVDVDPLHATGTVSVELDSAGKPRYVIHENVAWDFIAATDCLRDVAAGASVICYGSLSQRNSVSRDAVRAVIKCSGSDALKVFDVNLRQSYFSQETIATTVAMSDVLKCNEEELPVIAELLALDGAEEYVMHGLIEKFGLKVVALTKGDQGSVVMSGSDRSELGPAKVSVVDTVGAGDAFTAALVMGLLAGRPLKDLHAHAAELAAYVCTQPGAMPAIPEHLKMPGTSAA
ncbi:MAG: carbohydrate kinase [Lentisphaerales bacterium]|nr:MAG: carbohydrate kinase [Lentisphaerales bacterium]